MSKVIQLTKEMLEEIQKDFKEELKNAKLLNGKISFDRTIGSVNRKATLYILESAYIKMQALVNKFDEEIGWHGVVKRSPNEKDAYIVTDILVYPQKVTGTTVETDQEPYQRWIYDHEDDVFDNIRLQGHSHVNMSVTPSSVDLSYYENRLEQVGDDKFYIFLILNKRNEKTIKIYDIRENVLFETEDVNVVIFENGIGLEKFLKEAKDMVKGKRSFQNYTTSTDYLMHRGFQENTQYSFPCTSDTETHGFQEEDEFPVKRKKKKKRISIL